MIFETSSSITSLIFNGKIAHIINPWHIIVDVNQETITIRKRNTVLIGVDEEIVSFRYVRKITIDEHIFGADIHIKVVGGNASAYYIAKKDAKTIRKLLMDYNQTKRNHTVVF